MDSLLRLVGFAVLVSVALCDNRDLPFETGAENCDAINKTCIDVEYCVNSTTGFECVCKEGYFKNTTSNDCEDVDECVTGNNTCSNTSTVCVNTPGGYWCDCQPGYSKDQEDADECKDTDECVTGNNTCSNITTTCRNSQGGYWCDCRPGYVRLRVDECEDVDECDTGNNTCSNTTTVCTNTPGGYRCDCRQGYKVQEDSDSCVDVDECDTGNNTCSNTTTVCTNTPGGYRCDCRQGYTKVQEDSDACVDVDECETGNNTCANTTICTNTPGAYRCDCRQGYVKGQDPNECEDVDECDAGNNTCSNTSAICVNTPGSYRCDCRPGYVKVEDTEECEDVDECTEGTSGCGDNTQCVNTEGSFLCPCVEGFVKKHGPDSNKIEGCVDADLCPLMTCKEGELCNNSTCDCAPGYERKPANSTACTRVGCDSNPCGKRATCTDGVGGFTCHCGKGFLMDEENNCQYVACVYPEMNDCQQVCSVRNNGTFWRYDCDCESPFTLNEDGHSCGLPENMTCELACGGGHCTNQSGSAQCVCRKGFVAMNRTCVDACTAGSVSDEVCPSGCLPDPTVGFKCNCTGKYQDSGDGVTCQLRDMCDKEESGYRHCTAKNAECHNNATHELGYTCRCLDGYGKGEDGVCTGLCNLTQNANKCLQSMGTCQVLSNGTTACQCPFFFQPTPDSDNRCLYASFSYVGTLVIRNDYSARRKATPRHSLPQAANQAKARDGGLPPTFSYVRLKRDIQDAMVTFFPFDVAVNVLDYSWSETAVNCTLEIQSPQNASQELTELYNECLTVGDHSDECLLPPNLVVARSALETATFKETNPCDPGNVAHFCLEGSDCSTDGKVASCRCKEGFSKVYTFSLTGGPDNVMDICEDIDECKDAEACRKPNTHCENTPGSYRCLCDRGYVEKNNVCVHVCDPNPCQHGECTSAGESDFACRCEDGFWGRLCDKKSEYKGSKDAAIVGGVLGALLGLTLLLGFFLVLGYKKKAEKLRSLEFNPRTELIERPRAMGRTNASYLQD